MTGALLVGLLRLLLPLLLAILPAIQGENSRGERALRDERAIFAEVCFAAAAAHTRQPIVLRSAASLQQFHAQLAGRCQRPLAPLAFDFTGGRVLFGFWGAGEGCGARHLLTDYARDEATNRIIVRAHLVTHGECPYQLLQPLWWSAPARPGVQVDLRVERP